MNQDMSDTESKMVTPKTTAFLKVVEKFRAPAALYQPSKLKGDGWIKISGIGRGGEAIIQMQEDAKSAGKLVPVVRFQFRHGKDFLNARILPGLPLERKGPRGFLFKSSSSNSGGYFIKTVSFLKFRCQDDAEDFMMWWLAKNGSFNELMHGAGNRNKALQESTNHGSRPKRKAVDLAEKLDPEAQPQPKKLRYKSDSGGDEIIEKKIKFKLESNIDLRNNAAPTLDAKEDTKTNDFENANELHDESAEDKLESGENTPKPEETKEGSEHVDEEEEVLIHNSYGSHSQDWMSAFTWDEDNCA